MIGTEIQNYRLIQLLGKGGMASVYKAQHKTLAGAFAAIKVLHPALASDDSIRQKFRTEAQLMSTFNHPNIGKVYDYAEDNGNLYLIMEYIEGPTLDELIRLHTGPIVESRARILFSKMLGAVGYAHRKGVIHRDLKPSNVLIAAEDEPKIIDFGIVKMIQDEGNPNATRTGQRIGTPLFMSPEQIIGRGVDNRTDIYALGVTLFQMVTGQLPYNPEELSQFEIEQKIVNGPLPPAREFYAGVSPHFQSLIDKATARQKEDRFQSCEEFAEALNNSGFSSTTQIKSSPYAPPPPAPPTAIASPSPAVNLPVINSFSADRTAIHRGEAVNLWWNTTSLQGVTITPLGNFPSATGSVSVFPETDTTYILQTGSQSQAIFVSVAQKKKTALWPILLVAGLATGVFFMLKTTNILGMEDPPVTPPVENTKPSGQERQKPVVITPTKPDPVPSPSGGETIITIPDDEGIGFPEPVPTYPPPASSGSNTPTTTQSIDFQERERIQNILLRYFSLQNSNNGDADIPALLEMFSYPVTRYFGKTNASPADIEKEMQRYYEKVVFYTNFDVDIENARILKSDAGNYIIDVSGPYTYRLRKDNSEKTKIVGNHIIMNADYKIISITER